MKLEDLIPQIEGIPYTSPRRGSILYQHIIKTKPRQCLELGFAHGVSSCYIAAALDELGAGHLTCVDLETGKSFQPSIEELLTRTRLNNRVTVVREINSYTWFLKKEIERASRDGTCEPVYDFCFIDGSKNWTIDACAFFLVDKLLRHNATLLFDDYMWTYQKHEQATGKSATDGITHRALSKDEYATPAVRSIFDLLVMQHPNYGDFRIQDDSWAWATK